MVHSSLYSLEKLSQYVGNDQEQIKEMIQLFLETVPPDIDKIVVFSQQREWAEVSKVTHRIKPSFDVFEMTEILDDIKKIHQIAKENNVDNSIDNYLSRLSINFNKVTTLLKSEL